MLERKKKRQTRAKLTTIAFRKLKKPFVFNFEGRGKCMDDREGRRVPRTVELGKGVEVKAMNYSPGQATNDENGGQDSQGFERNDRHTKYRLMGYDLDVGDAAVKPLIRPRL